MVPFHICKLTIFFWGERYTNNKNKQNPWTLLSEKETGDFVPPYTGLLLFFRHRFRMYTIKQWTFLNAYCERLNVNNLLLIIVQNSEIQKYRCYSINLADIPSVYCMFICYFLWFFFFITLVFVKTTASWLFNSRLSIYCRNTILFLNLHTSVTWFGYFLNLEYFRCKRSADKSIIQWCEITFPKNNSLLRYFFLAESDDNKSNVIWLWH